MTAKKNGDQVRIKGEDYKVVGVGAASFDGKFFGKRRFVLRKLGTNDLFYTYGKQVQHNSRIAPVSGSVVQ